MSQQSPTTSPPPGRGRDGLGPHHAPAVMFGGSSAVWTGKYDSNTDQYIIWGAAQRYVDLGRSNWSLQHPTTTPPSGAGQMVLDRATKSLILLCFMTVRLGVGVEAIGTHFPSVAACRGRLYSIPVLNVAEVCLLSEPAGMDGASWTNRHLTPAGPNVPGGFAFGDAQEGCVSSAGRCAIASYT